MKTKQHTPTPWKLNSGYNAAGSPFFEIKDTENFNILTIRGGSLPTPTDAAFIIRAVNAHELLRPTQVAFHEAASHEGRADLCSRGMCGDVNTALK